MRQRVEDRGFEPIEDWDEYSLPVDSKQVTFRALKKHGENPSQNPSYRITHQEKKLLDEVKTTNDPIQLRALMKKVDFVLYSHHKSGTNAAFFHVKDLVADAGFVTSRDSINFSLESLRGKVEFGTLLSPDRANPKSFHRIDFVRAKDRKLAVNILTNDQRMGGFKRVEVAAS